MLQKLTLDFKDHRNLNNFKHAVESTKSWNSVSYICLKTTFFHPKRYLQIYLTLRSTTCVKIHQIPYVIILWVIFHDTTRLYFFSWNVTHFWLKYLIKVQIFRFFTVQVEIRQISHVIFQTKSEFFFKFWISVMKHNSSVLF